VDGLSIQKVIESEHGVSGFLGEIEQSLKTRTYQAVAISEPLSVEEVIAA
jgi:hypothetical protein